MMLGCLHILLFLTSNKVLMTNDLFAAVNLTYSIQLVLIEVNSCQGSVLSFLPYGRFSETLVHIIERCNICVYLPSV